MLLSDVIKFAVKYPSNYNFINIYNSSMQQSKRFEFQIEKLSQEVFETIVMRHYALLAKF